MFPIKSVSRSNHLSESELAARVSSTQGSHQKSITIPNRGIIMPVAQCPQRKLLSDCTAAAKETVCVCVWFHRWVYLFQSYIMYSEKSNKCQSVWLCFLSCMPDALTTQRRVLNLSVQMQKSCGREPQHWTQTIRVCITKRSWKWSWDPKRWRYQIWCFHSPSWE